MRIHSNCRFSDYRMNIVCCRLTVSKRVFRIDRWILTTENLRGLEKVVGVALKLRREEEEGISGSAVSLFVFSTLLMRPEVSRL